MKVKIGLRMLSKIIKKIAGFLIKVFFGKKIFAEYLGVEVGEGSRIYTDNWGSEPFLVEIGNGVTVSVNVTFLTHDGATWLVHDDTGRRYQKFGRIRIRDNSFIGANVTILPGVEISENVVVAAGSVVTKSISMNTVVGGNPAVEICSFQEYKNKVTGSCINEKDLDEYPNYQEKAKAAARFSEGWEV